MATEVETLVVRMEANLRGYERALAKANGDTQKRLNEIESSFVASQRNIGRIGADAGGAFAAGLKGALGGAAGVIAGVFSAREVGQAASEFTAVQNSLKAAGFEGERLKAVYAELFAVAQRQAAPLRETIDLFTGLSVAQKDLNATQPDLVRFTELTTQALRVSGVSAQTASGALLQLRQAMGGGVIQAQEYNSLIDGARPLLEAVAFGLKEAGGSVSKLTALVKDGQVSSEAFFRAGLAGAPLLEERLSSLAETPGQAFQRLKNNFVDVVGRMDEALGASTALASGMGTLADAVNTVGGALVNAIKELQRFNAEAGKAVRAALEVRQAATSAVSAGAIEARLRSDSGLSPLQRRGLEQQLEQVRQSAREAQGRQMLLDDAVPVIPFGTKPKDKEKQSVSPNAVSLKDFKLPGQQGGGGGGGGKSAAEEVSDFERATEALQKRTAAVQQQTAVIGLNATETARSNAARELMTALEKDGVPVTDEMRAKVKQLSDAHAEATRTLEAAQEQQKAFADLQQFIGTALSSFFSDIVSGGKNAQDALMNLTKRMADAAFQATLLGQGPLASVLGTKTGGGLVGMLFSGLKTGLGFASGGFVSGPGSGRSDSIPARLSNGEFVVNAAATRQNRALLEAINSGRALKMADGGYVGMQAIAATGFRRGGGGVNVVINNSSKAQVTARESNQGGQKSLEIMIDEMVAGRMQTPGSQTLRALQGVTGATPPLTRR